MMNIAIASGKGGTGKTTIAVNLAALLAEHTAIVLADLDVEEPNSGLFTPGDEQNRQDVYRMVPSWEAGSCIGCGLCQEVCNFHAVLQLGSEIMVFPELCHGCYACSELCPTNALPMRKEPIGVIQERKGSFTFIDGCLNIGQEQAVPLIIQTKEYAKQAAREAAIVLYDCPPGTSCPVVESIKDADFILLVTEPTPFGLYDLTLAVDTVRDLNLPFGVVINRDGVGDAGVQKWCEERGIEIVARIPNSRKAAELYSRAELIYREIPEIREALQVIADRISTLQEGRPA
ncbi:MAG: ATP-binding protein [Spirochaetota bacterium]